MNRSRIRKAREIAVNSDGTISTAQPCRRWGRSSCDGDQTAKPIATTPTAHRKLATPPGRYVPSETWMTYTESAAPRATKPAPRASSARSGRQPVSANADERDQHDVEERVGEVDDDRRHRSRGPADHGVVDERHPDGGHREPGDDPVQPPARRQIGAGAADEPHRGQVGTGVQRQPQDVAHRWVGRLLPVLQPERPDDGADGVGRQTDGQWRPDAPSFGHSHDPNDTADGGPDDDRREHP